VSGIVGVAAFQRHTEALNTSPTSAFGVQKDPSLLSKLPAESSNSSSNESNSSVGSSSSTTSGTSNSSSAGNNATSGVTPAFPLAKTPSETGGCTMNMDDAVSSYNHDVEKKKSKLDSTLSFVSLGAISVGKQLVSDYNVDVTSLFNEYLNEAKVNNCTWPIKSPALLQPDYSH
jgi:hypothetical protein